MCAGHIIDDIVAALVGCASITSAFRDGMAFLIANACRDPAWNASLTTNTAALVAAVKCGAQH
jgi:hypothetical protein